MVKKKISSTFKKQSTVNWSNSRLSKKDGKCLLKVCKLNTINTHDKLLLMKAGLQVNAITNRAKSGGYENEYINYYEILFLLLISNLNSKF